MNGPRKFWMVYGLNQGSPRYEHSTKEAAQAEARRLASVAPGVVFVVLAVVDAYWAPKPEVEKLKVQRPRDEFDDGIPF